jgi:ADP-ribosylglycohydrolase
MDVMDPAASYEARVVGAVLGAALGDALGYPVEFLDLHEIHARHGPQGLTGPVLTDGGPGRRVALYSDDTQLAEAVLRGLLAGRARRADLEGTMQLLAARFVEWDRHPLGGHRAPGGACRAGCQALARGVKWSEAGGVKAGGCGSVMRVYPLGLLFAEDPERTEAWAVAQSRLTHRDPIALGACAGFALAVGVLTRGGAPAQAMTALVEGARRHSGPTADMIQLALDEARSGVGPEKTLVRLSGFPAHEAAAAAAYVFVRHAEDARAALLEAVNTRGDSDSIGTLVGALVGAHLGVGALPAEWLEVLERGVELRQLALEAARREPW